MRESSVLVRLKIDAHSTRINRLCALQNGTTNSAHELVDKLNKADLPSSVGER